MKYRIVLALMVMVSFGGSLAAQEFTAQEGYREEMRWTEEIIEQVTHSVYSAGIEPKFFVGERSAVTPAAAYVATGPLRTDLADSGELNGFWGRLGYSVAF